MVVRNFHPFENKFLLVIYFVLRGSPKKLVEKETIIFRAKKLKLFFRAKKFFLERQQNGVVFQLSVDLTNELRMEHKNEKPYQRRVKKSTSF